MTFSRMQGQVLFAFQVVAVGCGMVAHAMLHFTRAPAAAFATLTVMPCVVFLVLVASRLFSVGKVTMRDLYFFIHAAPSMLLVFAGIIACIGVVMMALSLSGSLGRWLVSPWMAGVVGMLVGFGVGLIWFLFSRYGHSLYPFIYSCWQPTWYILRQLPFSTMAGGIHGSFYAFLIRRERMKRIWLEAQQGSTESPS